MLVHHLCIQTDKYEASKDFYLRVLGFELVKETPGFHSRDYNTWLKHGGLMIELQTGKAGSELIDFSKSNKGLVHFGVAVDDLEGLYKMFVDKGYDHFAYKEGKAIYEVKGGKLLKVIAPEGTIIEYRDQTEIG